VFPICSLFSHMSGPADHDLPFRVEQWDDADRHVEELIALVGDPATIEAMIARGEMTEADRGRAVWWRHGLPSSALFEAMRQACCFR